MVGAMTTRIDIRIGHFSKESITGSIISLDRSSLVLQVSSGAEEREEVLVDEKKVHIAYYTMLLEESDSDRYILYVAYHVPQFRPKAEC
jgi:hypothetical protein